MTTTTPTPVTLATLTARKRELARQRVLRQRRADARKHGYHGPLTRAELAETATAA